MATSCGFSGRSNILVAIQLICLSTLVLLLSSSGSGLAQRHDYRIRPGPYRRHDISRYYRDKRIEQAEKQKIRWRRMMVGRKAPTLEELNFGPVKKRTDRVKRHPHIFYEQYKVVYPPVSLPYRPNPPAPASVARPPPDFYRMLWLDTVDPKIRPEITGLWSGNAIVLFYDRDRELILTSRFEPKNKFNQTVGALQFLATKFVENGEERVRKWSPDEVDFGVQLGPEDHLEHPPRMLFNYGTSTFQLFDLVNPTYGSLDYDKYPDTPKKNCLLHRYMPFKPREGKMFRSMVTNITVHQRPNLDTVRYAEVEHADDALSWYDTGMPVTCDGKLAYVVYIDPTERSTGLLKFRVVSIFFLIGEMNHWATQTIWKDLYKLPRHESSMEASIRFGK